MQRAPKIHPKDFGNIKIFDDFMPDEQAEENISMGSVDSLSPLESFVTAIKRRLSTLPIIFDENQMAPFSLRRGDFSYCYKDAEAVGN